MTLPKNAKQVFSGIIFDVYQWPQKLYDGSTATFEMLSRPNTLQVLPTIGKKIGISHEQQPTKGKFITLLGGRQDEGETPLQGAKRELIEESGLTSKQWSQLQSYKPYSKIDWHVYLYLARQCKQTTIPNPGAGEKVTVEWYTFDDFIDIATSEGFGCKEFSLSVFQMKKKNALKAFRDDIFG